MGVVSLYIDRVRRYTGAYESDEFTPSWLVVTPFTLEWLSLLVLLVLGRLASSLAPLLALLSVIFFMTYIFSKVWSSYAVYKLVRREEAHRTRISKLYSALSEALAALGRVEATAIENVAEEAESRLAGRSPGGWAAAYFIFPLFVLYVLSFLSKDLERHWEAETRLYRRLSEYLAAEPPVLAETRPPRRRRILYMLAAIMTVGLLVPYWAHVVNKDWNMHTKLHEETEKWLLENLEKLASGQQPRSA